MRASECMLMAFLIACRWATCLMGAHQIVDQIYKYRLRTERYDVMGPPSFVDEGLTELKRYDVMGPQSFVDEGLTELTPKQRSSAARLEFVNTVSSTPHSRLP